MCMYFMSSSWSHNQEVLCHRGELSRGCEIRGTDLGGCLSPPSSPGPCVPSPFPFSAHLWKLCCWFSSSSVSYLLNWLNAYFALRPRPGSSVHSASSQTPACTCPSSCCKLGSSCFHVAPDSSLFASTAKKLGTSLVGSEVPRGRNGVVTWGSREMSVS